MRVHPFQSIGQREARPRGAALFVFNLPMKPPLLKFLLAWCTAVLCTPLLSAAETAPVGPHTLRIAGTQFFLNDQPFPYTAISFFNAIHNPAFNRSAVERKAWIAKFQKYGINVLRVWGQWDNKRGFVDSGPDKSLYQLDGTLREEHGSPPVLTFKQ